MNQDIIVENAMIKYWGKYNRKGFVKTHCNSSLVYKLYWETYRRSVHYGVRYVCKKCFYKANRKTSLQKHINSVQDRQQYYCQQCSYDESRKTELKKHMMAFQSEMMSNCEQCD